MELTVEQTEILFEATEIFLAWYRKYNTEYPTFSELLQTNHVKILDIFDGEEYTEEDVTITLNNLKDNYLRLFLEY